MKKALVVLAATAVVLNLGMAGFAATPCPVDKTAKPCPAHKTAVKPCPCDKTAKPCPAHKTAVKPCPCDKTAKPCPVVKKEAVKGVKTGGAAQVRPINMTKEEKILREKREKREVDVKKSEETQKETPKAQ